MMTTFPAIESFGNPFPPFETGFFPWEIHEPFFKFEPDSIHEQELVEPSPHPSQEPVSPVSGSDTTKPVSTILNSDSNSDSNDSNRKRPNIPRTSSCDVTIRLPSIVDERKRRRMISNRESARRSRMRKQKHLENLRDQANRMRFGNRELTNRILWILNQDQTVRRENDRLRSEAAVLRQRLWDIRQVLLVRELHHRLNPLPMQ